LQLSNHEPPSTPLIHSFSFLSIGEQTKNKGTWRSVSPMYMYLG
jgi:hypothetical protein